MQPIESYGKPGGLTTYFYLLVRPGVDIGIRTAEKSSRRRSPGRMRLEPALRADTREPGTTSKPRSLPMKNFLYLSLSVLCLAVSALIGFHIGNTTARAEAPTGVITGVIVWEDETYAILDNGDVYRNNVIPRAPAMYIGNYWGGERLRPQTSPSTETGGGKER
ncbi:MAG: hypothetical protein P8181_03095, partial [bacterium]